MQGCRMLLRMRIVTVIVIAVAVITGSSFLLPLTGHAADSDAPIVLEPSKAEDKPIKLPVTEVTGSIVGSKENIKKISGTAAYLDKEDIRAQSYDDVNRVLRKVPGVYVREEDGFGLFPNISLRGVDPGRSSKVTIMEDGVMMAPAPYSAPGAYYSPTTGRMNAIEVLKGSSQIQFGPHTTGGVINYLSTPIPNASAAYLKAGFGRFNEIRTHAYFGNTLETSFGKIGYLVENWQRTNDGFKTIDTNPPDVRNGDKTGFTKVEPMIKMMFEPNSRLYQRFEFRLGYTDLDADETYLGATTADFRADPFRRYAASRFDNIATEQFRTHLRHFLQLADETLLTTTVYGNTFNRNWAKLDSCGGAPSDMSQCVESNTNLLTGNAAGSWKLRNNDRRYYSQGVEAVLDHTFRTGEVKQNIVAGARYHYDQMRRFQHDETYTQAANGALTAVAIGAPGSQDSRREGTKAIALHIRDYITFGRLTVSPGLRYEHLRFTLDRLSPQTFPETSRDANMDMWSGGVGLNYEVKTDLSLFGGIWRGVSNPEPGAHITENLGEESTLSFEAGVRYKNPRLAFGTELAFFHTDFNNLLVRDNIGGGSPKSENVGKIRNQGIEYQVQYDPGTHLQLPFKNPWYFNITYSNARIRTATTSNDQESLFAGAIPGAKVPYVPKVQFNLGSGIVYDKWNLNVDAYYVDPTFTTADNSDMQVNPINSTPNARFGRTDAFLTTDISGGYQYKKNVRLFTNFYNVTNAEYIVTRHPHGPRPGAPFMMFGGVEMTF